MNIIKKRHIVSYVIKEVSQCVSYTYPITVPYDIQQLLADGWEPWGSLMSNLELGKLEIEQLEIKKYELVSAAPPLSLYQVFVRYEEAPDVEIPS